MGKTMAIFMVMAMIATATVTLIPVVNAAVGVGDTQITGIVKSADTFSPINGVKVEYNGINTGNKSVAYTGSDGVFKMGVQFGIPENYTLLFTIEGYNSRLRNIGNTSFVGVSSDTGTTYLSPKSEVKGKIYIKDTTTPLAGVQVFIEGNDKPVLSDTNGKFFAYSNLNNVDINFYKSGYYSSDANNVLVDDSSYEDIYYMEKITPQPTIEVWGRVFEEGTHTLVDGARVSISEGDDKWITTMSDEDGQYSMMAYPGNYQIKASKEGYFTTFNTSLFFSVPTVAAQNFAIQDIELDKIDTIDRWFNGTISCKDSGNVSGAVASLRSTDGKYLISSQVNWIGIYSLEFYNPPVDVTFSLVVEKNEYFTNVSYTGITTGAINKNVNLTPIIPVHKLYGFIYDAETKSKIQGASVNIYSKEYLHTQTNTSKDNGYYQFMVHNNSNFWLVVDADGYQSVIRSADAITKAKYIEFGLRPSGSDVVEITYEFADWNTVHVKKINKITVDNISARWNADMKYDMGPIGLSINDGILDNDDVTAWEKYLKAKGIEQRDTEDFLTLNNTHYKLDTANYSVTIDGAIGPVSADATIYINSTYNYTIASALENPDSDIFELGFNATYDTKYVDYTNNIILPLTPVKFEMTDNTTETNKVVISGYNNPISINPKIHDGGMEEITMTVEKSMNGTAKAKVLSGTHYVLNSTYDHYSVIVPRGPISGVNTNITFSAQESTDKIGDITKANFTWNFGDGTFGYGITVKHDYTNASIAGELTVNLTIRETGNNYTYRDITVSVDSQNPVAGISAVATDSVNITYSAGALTVNEDKPVTFSGKRFTDAYGMGTQTIVGANSTDSIASGDLKGVIEKWYWSWGEEDMPDETITKDGNNNITHTYNKPGQYTINMITTDVIGRESANATWTVKVLDITAPEASFIMRDASNTIVTEVVENKSFQYDASSTLDNFDENSNLTFEWSFNIDGAVTKMTGIGVNFTFTKVGDFNITLKATDTAGNYVNKTNLIHVNLAQRPNILMKLGSMKFSASPGEAGKAMTISVNITNDGQSNATDIQTKFYIRNADGTDKEIGTATTSFLAIGSTATASISWTPGKKGDFSIWANSTCAGEHSSQWWDNKIDDFSVQKVTVDEAAWVMPAIIVGIVIVIIVVFLGMRFFMKSGTEKDETGEKRKKR
jgi:hypothetical protein